MKKLVTLIALSAISGSASAAVIANQDFDGGATGTGAWTYNNVDTTGDATVTGAGAGSGMATLNSTLDYGYKYGSGKEGIAWVSYRLIKPASSQWSGNHNMIGGGFLRSSDVNSGDMIGFAQYESAGNPGDYGGLTYRITIGGNHAFEATTSVATYADDVDLYVVGKLDYKANGDRTFYMTSIDWADRATLTEADVTSDFSATWLSPGTGWEPSEERQIDTLRFDLSNADASKTTTLDSLIAGDTALDVGVIPEPATLSLIATFAGAVLFIRRRLMM